MPWIVVDAHAHYHRCYPWQGFLDAAHANLVSAPLGSDATRQAAQVHGSPTRSTSSPQASRRRSTLILTETSGHRFFDALIARARGGRTNAPVDDGSSWLAGPTEEDVSLTLADGHRRLTIIAGHQIAAAEGLEVLIVAARTRPPDGLPIREVLTQARESGLVTIVPWGAGKWWFSRGRLVGRLIEEFGGGDFFLADHAGRPRFWPRSGHYARAEAFGVRELSGSDPLPFPGELTKVGTMGFGVRAPWNPARPAQSLLSAVRDPGRELVPFVQSEPVGRFLRNQVKMQLRKRRRTGR